MLDSMSRVFHVHVCVCVFARADSGSTFARLKKKTDLVILRLGCWVQAFEVKAKAQHSLHRSGPELFGHL